MDEIPDEDRERRRRRIAAEGAAMGAEALLDEGGPGVSRAFFTDSTSVPGFVLIGIAIRGVATATAIVRAREYDGFKLAALLQRPAESVPVE